MAQYLPTLKIQLEALDAGFSSFRDILMQLYKNSLATGGNPDIEKLKQLTREYTELRNLVASVSRTTHTFTQEVENSNGDTVVLTHQLKKINILNLTNEDMYKITNRMRGIFKYLIEETQSYVR